MKKLDRKLFLQYTVSLLVCAAIFTAVVFATLIPQNEIVDYAAFIDDTREYSKVEITSSQRNILEDCRIENYYESGEYRVVRVVAENGYVDEIQLLVLLEGTTVSAVMGIEIKETDKYGARCFRDSFLNQFVGLDLKNRTPLTGREDNYEEGDVLYVTHATYTSRAIIEGFNALILFINTL